MKLSAHAQPGLSAHPTATRGALGNFSGLTLALATLILLGACSDQVPDAATTTAPVSQDQASTSLAAMIEAAAADPATTMYQSLDGQGFDISALQGKKVFLNFWATWCAPCIREIPAISRAAEALESENYLFVLASDESLDTISNFLTDREFTGNFIKLNGYFGGHGIDAVPSSVLYDETGNVIKTWAGAYEWDSEAMLAELRTP